MASQLFFNQETAVIYYDLETNGKRPFYQSAIMQMALSSTLLPKPRNMYVYPYDDIIGATEIHGIDEKKLNEEKAISSRALLEELLQLFSDSSVIYYFLAYNNFGFDQNVLEYHFRHHQMKVPQNWFFVDIMPFIQRYYPDFRKNGGYKLSNVYQFLCKECEGKEKKLDFHTAHDDVYALEMVCKTLNPKRAALQPYIRGAYTNGGIMLSPISAIAGYAHFFGFEKKKIHRIQDLHMEYTKVGKKPEILKAFLKEQVGIYSNFYLEKIIEQIQILDELCGKNKG